TVDVARELGIDVSEAETAANGRPVRSVARNHPCEKPSGDAVLGRLFRATVPRAYWVDCVKSDRPRVNGSAPAYIHVFRRETGIPRSSRRDPRRALTATSRRPA